VEQYVADNRTQVDEEMKRACDQMIRQHTTLNEIQARQVTTVAELQALQTELAGMTSGVEKLFGADQEIRSKVAELEQKRNAMSLKLQELADKQRVLDQEHQQLHPFFRFMQDPHLQSQLAELEHGSAASVSSSCRVFYCSLKVYLAAYLMNTKMLADEVLRDSTTQVRGLVMDGLQAVISCACSAVPGGGLIEAMSSIVGKAVKEDHKQDVQKQLLESGHVSSFSLIEAEHLAQLLSLVLTKCFSCQLDQLTDAACKDLARDAVGRITVSLSTALSRLKQVESDEAKRKPSSSAPSAAAVSTSTSSSVRASSAAIGSAAVSPVAMTVNRLCELFLIAIRLPVYELKIKAFWKTKYPLRDPTVHPANQNDWSSDGLFNRSGVAVPLLASPGVIAAPTGAHAAVTVSSGLAPASSVSTPSAPYAGLGGDALALLSIPLSFWRNTLQAWCITDEAAALDVLCSD